VLVLDVFHNGVPAMHQCKLDMKTHTASTWGERTSFRC
jgi:hypothetical protein